MTATVRRPAAALSALAGSHALRIETGIDIDDDAAVARLRTGLGEEPDFDPVFVVAGVATQAGMPASQMSGEVAGAVFQTNAPSPVRFAESFYHRVAPDGLIVPMTSKLGSVSLNRGGWSRCRAGKAALNTLARSFAGQHAGAAWCLVLMHPGWVRTDLGGRRATLNVETSDRGMVSVIEARQGQRGCAFLDYTGATMPW